MNTFTNASEQRSDRSSNKATINSLLQFRPNNSVLNYYLEESNKHGSFYLGGHIQMDCNEEITVNILVNIKKQIEFRDICTGNEDYGQQEDLKKIVEFIDILCLYLLK